MKTLSGPFAPNSLNSALSTKKGRKTFRSEFLSGERWLKCDVLVKNKTKKDFSVRASTEDKILITAIQALGVAAATFGVGIVGGFALRVKLSKDAEKDVKRVQELYEKEGKPLPTTNEEIEALVQEWDNVPSRRRRKGVSEVPQVKSTEGVDNTIPDSN